MANLPIRLARVAICVLLAAAVVASTQRREGSGAGCGGDGADRVIGDETGSGCGGGGLAGGAGTGLGNCRDVGGRRSRSRRPSIASLG